MPRKQQLNFLPHGKADEWKDPSAEHRRLSGVQRLLNFAFAKAHPETLVGCFRLKAGVSDPNTEQTMGWGDRGEGNCIKHADQLSQIIPTASTGAQLPSSSQAKGISKAGNKNRNEFRESPAPSQSAKPTAYSAHPAAACGERRGRAADSNHPGILSYISGIEETRASAHLNELYAYTTL